MRRKILCLLACLMLTGCSLWPAKNAAEANLKNVKKLGSMYLGYLDKDGGLSSGSKTIRKLFVTEAEGLATKMVENSR